MFDGWKPVDAVEPSSYAFDAPSSYVMLQKLAANSMRAGLASIEVAALLKCLGLKPKHVRFVFVLHKTSIA